MSDAITTGPAPVEQPRPNEPNAGAQMAASDAAWMANADATLKLLNAEVDALQIVAAERARPWYKNAATIISLLAFLFSFGVTLESCTRTRNEDIRARREELRTILQKLTELPKEIRKDSITYSANPDVIRSLQSISGQESALLAQQASEILASLPPSVAKAEEFYGVGAALEATGALAEAARHMRISRERANPITYAAAAFALVRILFRQGEIAQGREEIDRLLKYADAADLSPNERIRLKLDALSAGAEHEARSMRPNEAEEYLSKAEQQAIYLPIKEAKMRIKNIAELRQLISQDGSQMQNTEQSERPSSGQGTSEVATPSRSRN